jgi:hypothetical protein
MERSETLVPPLTSRSKFASLLDCAFQRGAEAITHAQAVFSTSHLSRIEATAAATELLNAVSYFLEALPHVKDVRSELLIRKHIFSMMNDSARLRALSLGELAASVPAAETNTFENIGRRQRVAQELFVTEQSYVASMMTLASAFEDPLVPSYDGFVVTELTDAVLEVLGAAPTYKPGELLSSEEHTLIFGAVKQLLPLNKMMLSQLGDLLSLWNDESCVGDVLFTFAPFFKMYSESFTRQLAAGELLQKLRAQRPGFEEFLDTASASVACKGQTIESFLIMPVQRIPRYRLLLEQLITCTPLEHPDFARCSAALTQISSVASELNQSLYRFEQSAAMHKAVYSFRPPLLQLIQPHRILLHEGTLRKRRVQSPIVYVDHSMHNCHT